MTVVISAPTAIHSLLGLYEGRTLDDRRHAGGVGQILEPVQNSIPSLPLTSHVSLDKLLNQFPVCEMGSVILISLHGVKFHNLFLFLVYCLFACCLPKFERLLGGAWMFF